MVAACALNMTVDEMLSISLNAAEWVLFQQTTLYILHGNHHSHMYAYINKHILRIVFIETR